MKTVNLVVIALTTTLFSPFVFAETSASSGKTSSGPTSGSQMGSGSSTATGNETKVESAPAVGVHTGTTSKDIQIDKRTRRSSNTQPAQTTGPTSVERMRDTKVPSNSGSNSGTSGGTDRSY